MCWLKPDLLRSFCVVVISVGVRADVYPFSDCFNTLVHEGGDLTCHCGPNGTEDSGGSNPVISWPGHSSNDQLVLTDITRDMNGTNFTCSMRKGAVTRNVTYSLQVIFGPYDANTTIVAPTPFITDGTREMNLTCLVTNAHPPPGVSWTFVTCSSGGGTDRCGFTPSVEEDGEKVVCTATNPHTVLQSKAWFHLDLNYPPPDPPRIFAATNADVLQTGNTITCTVTGGKPRVTSVVLYCSNPSLPDMEDVNTTTSLSSSVIVDTRDARADHMLCFCSAVWGPEPGLYGQTSQASFLLEYNAMINKFRVNNVTELHLQESHMTPVVFHCDVTGRSTARVTLTKQGNVTSSLGSTSDVTEKSTDTRRRKVHGYSVMAARCEDSGTFTCTADSGYLQAISESVRLTVSCGPRYYNGTFSPPPILRSRPVVVHLVANPVPEYFSFSYIADTNDSVASDLTSLFRASCQGHEAVRHLVVCEIGRGDIPDGSLGLYNVTVSNTLGSFEFLLDVREAEPDDGVISAATAAVIAGTVAATILLIVIAFSVFLYRQKRSRGHYVKRVPQSGDNGDVECTRVAHRGSMAAALYADANDHDDPSNSPIPFVEVVPISSDIQFRSSNPSQSPAPFSSILGALSSDGQRREEEEEKEEEEEEGGGGGGGGGTLPTSGELLPTSSEVTAAPEGPTPTPTPTIPHAEVPPFIPGGPDNPGDGGGGCPGGRPPVPHPTADSEYPTVPARASRASAQDARSRSAGGAGGQGSATEQPNRDRSGSFSASLADVADLDDPVTDEGKEGGGSVDATTSSSSASSPSHLQSLMSPGQQFSAAGRPSRAFITKIYLPGQRPDQEGAPPTEEARLASPEDGSSQGREDDTTKPGEAGDQTSRGDQDRQEQGAGLERGGNQGGKGEARHTAQGDRPSQGNKGLREDRTQIGPLGDEYATVTKHKLTMQTSADSKSDTLRGTASGQTAPAPAPAPVPTTGAYAAYEDVIVVRKSKRAGTASTGEPAGTQTLGQAEKTKETGEKRDWEKRAKPGEGGTRGKGGGGGGGGEASPTHSDTTQAAGTSSKGEKATSPSQGSPLHAGKHPPDTLEREFSRITSEAEKTLQALENKDKRTRTFGRPQPKESTAEKSFSLTEREGRQPVQVYETLKSADKGEKPLPMKRPRKQLTKRRRKSDLEGEKGEGVESEML